MKEEISLTAKRENVERDMDNPRAIVHAETQHEAALMTEEAGLLEELSYEFPSPSDHHRKFLGLYKKVLYISVLGEVCIAVGIAVE